VETFRFEENNVLTITDYSGHLEQGVQYFALAIGFLCGARRA